tara:strand:- start:9 stop:386 length:378 start_codon:yes stop_codon:yes gene_type:complete
MEETMRLAERDLKLNKTTMEMRNEEVRLLTRMKQIGGRKRKNKYLGSVYEMYKKYRDDMLAEKKEQEKHILSLIKYLEKMRISQNNVNRDVLKKIDKEEGDLKKKLNQLKEEIKLIKKETSLRKK